MQAGTHPSGRPSTIGTYLSARMDDSRLTHRLTQHYLGRVRGGKSQSHLTYLNPKTPSAGVLFSGILDVGTLGNAGFASQQTLHSSDLTWDVSAYPRGLEISTAAVKGDNRTYSLNIYTDEVIPPPPPPLPSRSDRLILTSQPANRSPSTPPTSRINYKYSFTPTHSTDVQTTFAPWEAFKPNYRGREVEGLPPLDVTRHQVTGWSLMCQSFFGTQEKGGFSVEVLAIRVLA
ncbi:NADH:ubiquinone oxidoreductase intermediate-associated protein 30 [Fimicolochytrium jonesii]|uniref:NADH:ubiquinone oxidoreductase intermediate-associated protein 30 n=1 Tax=Fimicolochytrium jonesii TaxID=1396493 RepID=UPI0022FE2BC4|nr:NADH:ubiquinone oxidoreductase intermediate-associated protein 30 [Fimicolochytrium jonesii]KAI8826934.1 NADH:ubiquinone oxidoreductase intermediate-associated protein 30 [Fimicolochytrium jonesii]